MSTLLAIDTATTSCSVALSLNGEMHQIREDRPREHAKRVLPLVDSLLSEFGIGLSSLDALAYSSGPGSFTGLRVGFGIIQGLAFGGGLPVIGVSSLQVLAVRAQHHFGLDKGTVVPALDARMNEIYWGLYSIEKGASPRPVHEDRATPPEVLGEAVPGDIVAAVGDGWPFVEREGLDLPGYDPDLKPDANGVLHLALPLYGQGLAVAVEDAGLTYVRNEISWRKRQKIRRAQSGN